MVYDVALVVALASLCLHLLKTHRSQTPWRDLGLFFQEYPISRRHSCDTQVFELIGLQVESHLLPHQFKKLRQYLILFV